MSLQRHIAVLMVPLALIACGGGNQADPAGTASQLQNSSSPGNAAAIPGSSSSSTEKIASASEVEQVNILPVTTAPPEAAKVSVVTTTSGYHIDQINGNDNNDGSSARPWKTLARLKNLRLKTDEGIFLACGSKWRESLTLDTSQLVDGSIISWYGANCNNSSKPVISGADVLSGNWRKTGSVWSLALPANTPKITQLFLQRQPLRTAQWPNSQSKSTQAQSTLSGKTSIRLPPLGADQTQQGVSTQELVNATVQIQTEPWMIESRVIRRVQGTDLTLDRNTDFTIDAGDAVVFQDKQWMLDEPGEFFHDTQTGVVYLIAPQSLADADMNQIVVESATRDTALLISGRSNLKVANIAAEMTKTDGVIVNHATSAVLEGIDSSLNRWSGVRVNHPVLTSPGTRNVFIIGGRFTMNKLSGIDTGNTLNPTIINNTVVDTGVNQAEWSNAGIIGGGGALIIGNKVENSGFRGIQFSGTGDSQVVSNLVKSSCLALSDCGGLYTYTLSKRDAIPKRTLVSNNVIDDSTLTDEYTATTSVVAGIYIDDNSSNILVQNNTIISTQVGLYLHNSSDCIFESNSIWRANEVGILAVMDRTASNDMVRNVFRLNEIVYAPKIAGGPAQLPTIQTAMPIRFLHALNGEASISRKENIFSENKINHLSNVFTAVAETGRMAVEISHSRVKWADLIAEPANTQATIVAPVWKIAFGPEMVANGNFDQDLLGWRFWNLKPSATPSVVLQSGLWGCQGKCATFVASNAGDHFSTVGFGLKRDAIYRINLTATPQETADIAHPNIARPGPPYESFVNSKGIASSIRTLSAQAGEQIVYEGLFQASETADTVMNLRIYNAGRAVAFDSVSVREVLQYKPAPFREWGATIYADPTARRVVSCQDLGWNAGCEVSDVKGNTVNLPLTLAPGGAMFLMWSDSPWKQ